MHKQSYIILHLLLDEVLLLEPPPWLVNLTVVLDEEFVALDARLRPTNNAHTLGVCAEGLPLGIVFHRIQYGLGESAVFPLEDAVGGGITLPL